MVSLYRRLFVISISCFFLIFGISVYNDFKAFASSDIKFTNFCDDTQQCKELAIGWWKWAYGFSNDNNPLLDTKGIYCASGQSGSTWFLGGFFDSPYQIVRDCTLPVGKTIFFPILNSECSFLEYPNIQTKQGLSECAKQAQDRVVDAIATINGTELPHVRIDTGIFNFTLPNDSFLFTGAKAGTYETSGNGVFVGIKDLGKGNYILKFSGTSLPLPNSDDINPFSQDITYNLHIK